MGDTRVTPALLVLAVGSRVPMEGVFWWRVVGLPQGAFGTYQIAGGEVLAIASMQGNESPLRVPWERIIFTCTTGTIVLEVCQSQELPYPGPVGGQAAPLVDNNGIALVSGPAVDSTAAANMRPVLLGGLDIVNSTIRVVGMGPWPAGASSTTYRGLNTGRAGRVLASANGIVANGQTADFNVGDLTEISNLANIGGAAMTNSQLASKDAFGTYFVITSWSAVQGTTPAVTSAGFGQIIRYQWLIGAATSLAYTLMGK